MEKEGAVAEPQPGVVIFHHPPNDADIHYKSLVFNEPPRDVSVWGGSLYNCGEAYMSKLAYDNRARLERWLYFPQHYKGGMLPRPYYWADSRSDSTTFPKLRELGVSNNFPLPYLKLWRAPALESLVLLVEDEKHTFGSHFSSLSDEEATLRELRRLFSNLKTITFLKRDPNFGSLEATLTDVTRKIKL